MRSAEQILKDALVGRILVKREYEETEFNREIVDVDLHIDETREDAVITLTFKLNEDLVYQEVQVYSNEGLELK